jgi:HPt (histidine-containing phosphotransfer) domain-containing protein
VEITTGPTPDVPEEPSRPQEAAPGEIFPAALPGFDLAAGLKRLQGNEGLYRKLLLSFTADYSGFAENLREALASKDMDSTHGLVHSVKGVAGNLAATNVQAAASALEKLVKGADADTAPSTEALELAFSALERALNEALTSVQSLGAPDVDEAVAPAEAPMAQMPPQLPQEAVARIRDAVEMGDVTELTEIAEGLKSESDAFAPICDKIVQLAEDFDFDGITDLVKGL